MSNTIEIRHTIRISEEWGGPCVVFTHWLPEGEENGLVRKDGANTVKIWFDKTCVSDLHEVTDDYISKLINVTVNRLYIDVVRDGVSDELISFIRDERDAPKEIHHGCIVGSEDYNRLSPAYSELGIEIFNCAVEAFNRFIGYARNEKGQYWLEGLSSTDKNQLTSMNNRFGAKVKSDLFDWIRWCPPHIDKATVELLSEARYIAAEDWGEAQQFIAANSRTNLVFELLANAELLLSEGRRRSSLIEAASALEVALSRFAKGAKLEDLSPPQVTSRFATDSLVAQIEHLGVTGSYRYLLPILFPAEVLPDETLIRTQDLITVRNGLVHGEARDVDYLKVKRFLRAARDMCETLSKYTQRPKQQSRV